MRDAENRLIRIEPAATPQDGSKRVEFAYDYMSRRIRKKVSDWNGSTWVVSLDRKFIYHGCLLQ